MPPRSFTAETTASQLVADPEISSRIKDKVILTTGPSPNSLGEAFVKVIVKASPALLILAGRDTTKLEQTAQSIYSESPAVQTRILELNLSSLAEVRRAADIVMNKWTDIHHIDVLVNNAGIMATSFSLTEDGYEAQFATNHLGHFLFTNLIMGKILRSDTPRVINVASDAHRFSPIRWGIFILLNLPVPPLEIEVRRVRQGWIRVIINGERTGSLRRRICCTVCHWRRNLGREGCRRIVSIRGLFIRIWIVRLMIGRWICRVWWKLIGRRGMKVLGRRGSNLRVMIRGLLRMCLGLLRGVWERRTGLICWMPMWQTLLRRSIILGLGIVSRRKSSGG